MSSKQEVLLGFKNHYESRIMPQFVRDASRMLSDNPDGCVVFFEQRGLGRPTQKSKLVYDLTGKGFKPSVAISHCLYIAENGRMPSAEKFAQYYESFRNSPEFPKDLQELDRISATFPGRVRFLLGVIPDHSRDEYNNLQDESMKITHAIRRILRGNTKNVLSQFKDGAKALSKLYQMEEEQIAHQVNEELKKHGVIGVVATINAHHSGLRKKPPFSEADTKVLFDKMGDENITFSPLHALIRKMYFLPDKEITELEWHQALIGQVFYETTDLSLGNQNSTPRNSNDLAYAVSSIIRDTVTSILEAKRIMREIKNDKLGVIYASRITLR